MNRPSSNPIDVCRIWNLHGEGLHDAEVAARRRLREHPLDADAIAIVARSCFDRGDDLEAIYLLNQAIYYDPQHYESYYVLTKIYDHVGTHTDVVRLYERWSISAFNDQRSNETRAPSLSFADVKIGAALSFAGSPALDLPSHRNEYCARKQIRIHNFLSPLEALRLYRHLSADTDWRTFVTANGRLLATESGTDSTLTASEQREISQVAYDGALSGFASVHDADRPLPDHAGSLHTASLGTDILKNLHDLLNSEHFLSRIRSMTGEFDVAYATMQLMRLRPGHFATYCGAVPVPGDDAIRVASYVLNLTPEWRPEWGGLLSLRDNDSVEIQGYAPTFNSLDILAFPRGHWISVVAPFATGPIYCIRGFLCRRGNS